MSESKNGKDLPVKRSKKGEGLPSNMRVISALINPANKQVIENFGDPKVTAFIDFQIECLKMRDGANIRDVKTLYERFEKYVMYCRENGILPTNMTCYLAVGVSKDLIYDWSRRASGTEEQQNFAITIKQFFASVREGAAAAGILNTVYAIYLQKAHDGMSDQPQREPTVTDPLGDKPNAEEIAAKYADVVLPD